MVLNENWIQKRVVKCLMESLLMNNGIKLNVKILLKMMIPKFC